MITLGTLLRSLDDGCIGIVTWCDDPKNLLLPPERVYKVVWVDDLKSLHYAEEFEVIE